MKAANAAFRFLLELCALAAFVYWGFTTADGLAAVARGIGVPVLTIVVWGTFGAPGAPLRAAVPVRITLLAVIYGWAVAALLNTGQTTLAVVLAVAVVVNTALLFAFGQE